MKSLFVCQGNRVLHSLSKQELPLQLLDIQPLKKHGYGVFVELTDGTLVEVVAIMTKDQVLAFDPQYMHQPNSQADSCGTLVVQLH